ncbi:hypothetical protein BU24DRAFT_170361 [Aaosphaeria arxii CBS 175.79]|uniref:Zn(2)-C6 fungal-type domain-containing protein n=1 Tax=Aaosphaeria arxii CBS 175.79 TaxID=1450172 RepID=A0A6A5XYL4_9PLEO|nr:uncharacterized protein BU24DRAFT_170361 [Aaosphaeria arxii CBS 175.79]KAF2018405.1 hypothetical protein BU24DRAFT_170361 [Aaosphaeria arxii CBS 175.79]
MQDRSRSSPPTSGSDSRSRLSRKYTIRSQFGSSRQRGSRKSRPCDICKKRKTACVIPVEPPCLFCRSRGLICESNGTQFSSSETNYTESAAVDHPFDVPTETHIPDELQHPPAHFNPGVVVSPHAGTEPNPSPHSDAVSLAIEAPLQTPSHQILPSSTVIEPRSNSLTGITSLEDVGYRTSHCMGPAAEQDSHLLDAFRSMIYSDRDEVDANILTVSGGTSHPDEPPVHFLLLENEFPEHTNRAMQSASDDIEMIVHPYGPKLVRLYFRLVHPAYPILSKTRFLRQYSERKEGLPASLRGAVYALGSIFWDKDASLPLPCPFTQHDLMDRAHTSLRRELEAPNISKLQSCLLLLHPRPPDIDSVETPHTWIWAAQATACAQMVGLHRDPKKWEIAPWEKHLRKKLWWATYMTDCWSSVCHGNPPHIHPSSFDTEMLHIDDLRFDEDVPQDLAHLVDPKSTTFRINDAVRFLETVKVSIYLRKILDCSFQINATHRTTDEVQKTRDQLVALRQGSEEWRALIPHCLGVEQSGTLGIHWNAPLHLSFYAAQVLLFRGLMYPATRQAKNNPASSLRSWFTCALTEFQSFTNFMGGLTEWDLESFWVRHARSQLILCGNFLIYLFLLASEPDHVQAAFRLLEQFHHTLQRLGTTGNIDGRLLFRPVMLRIDSFFAQAPDLLKRGGTGTINSPPTTR